MFNIQKKECEGMPQATFTIKGNIKDFGRVDNAYAAFRREAQKALKDWELNIDISYEEKQGQGEIPQ